jgi:spermidine synthase
MAIWYEEDLFSEIKLRIQITQVLADRQTAAGHRTTIFDTDGYGKMFCLDNVLQCAEIDEHFYHELMAHVPMNSVERHESIAIIGGASGAMAREVLKHFGCKKLYLVEIDRENIDICRQFLPSINAGAYDDSRLEVIIEDATKWVKKFKNEFDLIFVDSPDPIGQAKVLFEEDFYTSCKLALKHDGVLVCQAGTAYFQSKDRHGMRERLRHSFEYVGFYKTSTQLHIGGPFLFGWASNLVQLDKVNHSLISERIELIARQCKYYCQEVHAEAFSHFALRKPTC